ncbi:uncharacterized protein LOC123891918 [Trifolium pratense]|uniref:uncharacterized protein LOC123891918 n=1 Tax=Trifolium pratense TaxID=57577 RepID=UPI001E69524D|nr:uncharacterized protein LOC123891918 [Trifolium pratense]
MWQRERFQWEEDQYREFAEIIAPFFPLDNHDKWLWLGDGMQGFTVKSAYLQLENMANNPRILEPVDFVFKRLWKCAPPSKVACFCVAIVTKPCADQGEFIQTQDAACRSTNVWWLGVTLIIPPNLTTSFAMWATCVTNKKEKAGMCLIWNAFVWVVWKRRYDSVFNNATVTVDEIVEQIKVVLWQWFIGRMAPCFLYE